MSKKYLGIAKLMILLLAVAGPLGLYQAWRNDRRLILADEDLRRTLISDNEPLLRQVIKNFFSEQQTLASATLMRHTADGPIQGLPPFPGIAAFAAAGGINVGDTTSADQRYLALLHNTDSFASGLPKRYAGLIELLKLKKTVLGPADHDRFHEVAAQFWEGRDLDAGTHAFLLSKLPDETCAVFHDQQRFLGLSTETKPDHFLVNLSLDGKYYFLELPDVFLERLNQSARSLNLNTRFTPQDAWHDLGDIRLTLKPETTPLAGFLYRRGVMYTTFAVVLVLILLLVYQVLVTYEKINKAQRQLLAATSHELRTPLAVIRQFAEMLVDRADHFPERTRTYHGFIHRETLKMQFLVENLLSAARFEFVKLATNASPFALKQWMEEIITGVEKLDEATQISVTCPDVQVTWDRSMMSQAVMNLLQNARIHAGTDIVVTVTVNQETVHIDIRDFGEHPDIKHLSRIRAFTPNRTSKKGLGLGLYLSDRIIRTHGGSLSFHVADPGLIVRLTLPQELETDVVS